MTNLTDTQRILLSSASQRDTGSVLPLPATIKASGGTSKAIDALVKRGLAEERETLNAAAAHRVDGDIRYGVFITATGAEAIRVEEQGEVVSPAQPDTTAARLPKGSSKTATVIEMLSRKDGATLPELIEVTGWLPHTTRAALTGLRKKGHEIARGQRNGATCYRIPGAA